MRNMIVVCIALMLVFAQAQTSAACSESPLTANDSVSGQLSNSDCSINTLISGSDVSKVDVYNLTLDATTTVSFAMTSTQFDAFIRIYNADYSTLQGEDDDSGANLDAAITDLSLVAGTYRVLANSSTQSADLGDYTITTVSAAPVIETVIVSSVLPASRSVQVASAATAFSSVINGGAVTATACGLSLKSSIDADFSYQTTNPATNETTGTVNLTTDIAPGAVQTFIFTITPNSPFAPEEVELNYFCANAANAGNTAGLNTLLLSANDTAVADVVALVASVIPGRIDLPDITATGFAAFAVASVNVGSGDDISVTADTGAANLDVNLLLCQTEPSTGACINPTAPSSSPVEVTIGAGETPTFGIFVAGNELVDFDPANSRVFVRFKDQSGITRGATSVAVKTAAE